MATSAQFRPVLKNELDIFKPRSVQVTQTGYETIPLKPINAVTSYSTRLEFFHSGRGTDFYRNLNNTFLHLKLKVCKRDNNPIDAANEAGLINYFGQTIIKSLEIALNGTVITRNTENYAHRAYLEACLTSDHLDIDCQLAAAGFTEDTGTTIDVYHADNKGLKSRIDMLAGGKDVEVIGRLHTDIGNSNLYLPNGLDLSIVLNLNDTDFMVFAKAKEAEAVVKILDCTLFTEICHINPAVLSAHARAFQNHNAIYPIQHVEVNTVQIPKDITSWNIDNVYNGTLPSVLLVGFVDNSAMAGSQEENPLCLRHYSLQTLNVVVNGVIHQIGPLDFSEIIRNKFIRGYHSLLKATGLLTNGQSPLIKLKDYAYGKTLLGIDLSPEGSAATHGTHSSMQRTGNMRLEVLFKTALTKAATLITYSLHEGASIEIDKYRNVFVSF